MECCNRWDRVVSPRGSVCVWQRSFRRGLTFFTWHSHFFHLLFSPYTFFFCEISLATKEWTRTRFCLRMRCMMCEVLKTTSDANVSQQASIGTFVFRNANIAFCKDGGVVRPTTSKDISQRHLWDFGARENVNSTGKISTRHTKKCPVKFCVLHEVASCSTLRIKCLIIWKKKYQKNVSACSIYNFV